MWSGEQIIQKMLRGQQGTHQEKRQGLHLLQSLHKMTSRWVRDRDVNNKTEKIPYSWVLGEYTGAFLLYIMT